MARLKMVAPTSKLAVFGSTNSVLLGRVRVTNLLLLRGDNLVLDGSDNVVLTGIKNLVLSRGNVTLYGSAREEESSR